MVVEGAPPQVSLGLLQDVLVLAHRHRYDLLSVAYWRLLILGGCVELVISKLYLV